MVLFKHISIPKSIKNLLKVGGYNGIATSIRMVLGFILNKINSIYLGPSGFALVGQFLNFIQISQTLGSGGIQNGIIKYVSEFQNDLKGKNKVIITSISIVFFCSSLVGIVCTLFCKSISSLIFQIGDYWIFILFFGIINIVNSFGVFLTALLNGIKQYNKLITAGIITNITNVALMIPLVITFNVYGAFSALLVNLIIVVIVYYSFIKKYKLVHLKIKIYKTELKKLSQFSLMAFTTSMMSPLFQLLLRTYVVKSLSIESAGYWDAITKLSNLYLGGIIATLGMYYLPKLSEIKDKKLLKKEILMGYSIIIPLMIILCLSIFLFRDFIIRVLYSEEFLPMNELFKFQLLGDFFKISSWLLAYLTLAKAMTKLYIFIEVAFGLFYIFLAYFLIQLYGVKGITIAYACNYFALLIFVIFRFRKLIFSKNIL